MYYICIYVYVYMLTLASLNIFQKFVLFSYVMALFKAVVWALIFLTKLRFPPGVSIATICYISLLYYIILYFTKCIALSKDPYIVCDF